MIVRINQIGVADAERDADWASAGIMGPLAFSWPPETRVLEFLILEQDEQQQVLHEAFRQAQLRMALPHAIAALREAGEEIVIRLDGPVAPRELLPAFWHLTQPDLTGRYAISEVRKLDPSPLEVLGSVRIHPSPQTCSDLCLDGELGLNRSVRLRAFCVPEALVAPILDITDAEDERWKAILPNAGFVLTTTRSLRSIQIFIRRHTTAEVKRRLSQSLMLAAQSALASRGGAA